ncbi:hypothetical protein ACLOJK_029381, partial [Asimina triloba]
RPADADVRVSNSQMGEQQISENRLQSILKIRAIRNPSSSVFVGIKQADGGGSQQGKS